MTSSKDCCHDDYYDHDHSKLKRLTLLIAFAISLILLLILLVWLILRPTKPHFILQDTTIYTFNLTQPNFLTSTFQVTISSRNPNERIGVYYDRLDIFAVYRNQPITIPTRIPPNYEGHKDMAIWSPFISGQDVPIAPYLGQLLQQDLNAGLVLVHVKIDGRVRWKVGSWVSGRYRMWVNCPAYITSAKIRDNGGGVGLGEAGVKFQLASGCQVDV